MIDKQQTDRERIAEENRAPAVQAGDDDAQQASGSGKVQGSLDGVRNSGKLSSEGSDRPADAPDAGSPGGMGGVAAQGGGSGRPPGGVSPMAPVGGS